MKSYLALIVIVSFVVYLIVEGIFSYLENKKLKAINRLLCERNKKIKKRAEYEKRRRQFEDFWNMN